MDFYIKKIFYFFSFFAVIIFFGCSNSPPKIDNVNTTVVFEFDDFENLPSSRLCVFVSPFENVRRVEKFSVLFLENDYEWETNDILQFQTSSKYYAGYTNFVMPKGEKFPNTEIQILYTESDEDEASCVGKLEYDSKFYECNLEEALKIIKSENYLEKISIYNENSTLIYFGDYVNELKSNENLLKKYKNANFMRKIWCSQDNSVICILPIEELIKKEN